MADIGKKGLFSIVKDTLNNLTQRAAADHFEAHLDQLIHQTQDHIREQEEAINTAHANELLSRSRVEELTARISDLEEQAILAIRGRRPSRAREISSQLEPLMADLRTNQTNYELAGQQISQRKLLIEAHEGQIRRFRHQLGLRRASENLQRSQEAIYRFGETASTPSSGQSQADASPTETASQIFQRLSEKAKSSGSNTGKTGKSAKKSVTTKKTTKKAKKAVSKTAKKTKSVSSRQGNSNKAKE